MGTASVVRPAGVSKAGKRKQGQQPSQQKRAGGSKPASTKAVKKASDGSATCSACKAPAAKLSACDDCHRQLCGACNLNTSCGSKMCKQCSPTTLGGERKPCSKKCRHCGRKDGWVCQNCEDRVCENCEGTPHCEVCLSAFLCTFCEDECKREVFCQVCDGLTVCQNCCEAEGGHDGEEREFSGGRECYW